MNPRLPDYGGGGRVLALIRKMWPVEDATRYTPEYWEDLHRRFRVHRYLCEALCLAGLFAGFFLPRRITGVMQVWDIPLGLGVAACLPLVYLGLLMLYKRNRQEWLAYTDYMTMLYAIPWKAQVTMLLLLGGIPLVVGVVGRFVMHWPV